MTFPMTRYDKSVLKNKILNEMDVIYRRAKFALESISLSEMNCFNDDYIYMAKNEILGICNMSQGVEHMLHELMDAPEIAEGEYVGEK